MRFRNDHLFQRPTILDTTSIPAALPMPRPSQEYFQPSSIDVDPGRIARIVTTPMTPPTIAPTTIANTDFMLDYLKISFAGQLPYKPARVPPACRTFSTNVAQL